MSETGLREALTRLVKAWDDGTSPDSSEWTALDREIDEALAQARAALAAARREPVGEADEDEAWVCDWVPDDLNPGPECPYCVGQMCARFDGLGCRHDQQERHGYPTFAHEALQFLADRYGHTVEDDGEDNWARLSAIEAAIRGREGLDDHGIERMAREHFESRRHFFEGQRDDDLCSERLRAALAAEFFDDIANNEHGQLCPIWTRRPERRHKNEEPPVWTDCDCWQINRVRRLADLALGTPELRVALAAEYARLARTTEEP